MARHRPAQLVATQAVAEAIPDLRATVRLVEGADMDEGAHAAAVGIHEAEAALVIPQRECALQLHDVRKQES
ncbi:MAG: hypothetical protein LRY38_08650 [Aeromonadaceae bacterium]|nr:hypothetical protein [Aeromonadaceae bacterium]